MRQIPRLGKLTAAAVMTMVAAASVITLANGPSDPDPVNVADPPSSLSTPSADGEEPSESGAPDVADEQAAPSTTGTTQGTQPPARRSAPPAAGSQGTGSGWPRPASPATSPPAPRSSASPPKLAPTTAAPQPTPSPSPEGPNLVGDLLDALLGG